MLVRGIGDIMTPVDASLLDDLWIVAAKIPGTEVSTREAYAGVTPHNLPDGSDFASAINCRPEEWVARGLINDFEESVFAGQPKVGELKALFATTGCAYCSMSGSGSTVFAVYDTSAAADDTKTIIAAAYPEADIFTGRLSSLSPR